MQFGPTTISAVLLAVETAVNKALEYDPVSQQRVQEFEGLILEIESTQPVFSVFISSAGNKLSLASATSIKPSAKLSGKLKDLASLYKKEQHSLADSGVSSSGDLQCIALFQKLIANIDIDWEGILNQFTGDVVGHSIASSLSAFRHWTEQRSERLPSYLSLYLQDELQLIPSATEIKDFSDRVDELRAATDRLNAKFDLLKTKLETEG